jgi:hypothetical protein
MFQITVHLNQIPCLQPNNALYPAALGKANSFCVPLGSTPGRGWVLIQGSDLAAVRQAENLTLAFIQRDQQGQVIERVALQNVSVVGCERMTGNGSADSQAVFLLELADARWIVANFTDVGKLAVNWRASAAAADFIDGTEFETTASLLAQLWTPLSSIVGSLPSLPSEWTDPGPPQNLILDGMSAWDAVHVVLGRVGLTTYFDPQSGTTEFVEAEPTTLVSPGTGAEMELFTGGAFQIESPQPETIRVYFPIHLADLGQEHDTGTTGNVLTTARTTSIDIATNISTAVSGSVLPLWDTLPAVATGDGTTLTNTSELTAKASAVAAAWLAEQQGNAQLRQWIGLVGGQQKDKPVGWETARAIRWRVWDMQSGGSATELLDGGPLVAKVAGGADLLHAVNFENPKKESPRGNRLAERFAQPAYPRLIDLIEIQSTSTVALAAGVYEGKVRRWSGGELTTRESCWFKLAAGGALQSGDLVWGRLSGTEAVSSSVRPLYVGLVDAAALTTGNCCYLVTAETSDSYSSATVISLDAEAGADGRFSLDSNVISVATSGTAKLAYQVAAERSSGSGAALSQVTIEQKPLGGSWTEVAGSKTLFSQPAIGSGGQSASHVGVEVLLSHGDQIRLVIERIAGSDPLATVAGGVQFFICPCGAGSGQTITPTTGLVARWTVGSEPISAGDVWLSEDGLTEFVVTGGDISPAVVTGSPAPPAAYAYLFGSSLPYFSGEPTSDLFDPESYTIAAWVQDSGSGTGATTWLRFGSDDHVSTDFSLLGYVASNLNSAYWNQATSGGNSNITSTMTITAWTHIAIVGNGSQMREYRDGTLVDTVNLPAAVQSANITAVQLGILSGNGGLKLADLRIYNRQLTAAEIGALAAEGS